MRGLVVKKNADIFDVRVSEQVFSCTARGNLKKDGIFVGDKVNFDKSDKIIKSIIERKNLLIRPPMANLEKMFIVIASKPAPDLYLVDKLILFCQVKGIEPILCVNKVEDEKTLTFYNEINCIYKNILKVIKVSAKNNDIASITSQVRGICAFAGQSAVGKSSLINAIFNDNLEKIGSFAKRVERGKQTTRTVTLYKMDKGYIADTAGFSKLDEYLIDIDANELSRYYKDFLPYLDKCKFRTCLHKNSDSCEIIKRVKSGDISKVRYENYLKLLKCKQNEKKWEVK